MSRRIQPIRDSQFASIISGVALKRCLLALIILGAGCAEVEENAVLPTLALLPTQPLVRDLDYWEVVQSRLSSREQVEFWRFSGRQGDAVNVRARGQVNLRLEASDGALLGVGSDLAVTLPDDGVYIVQVRIAEAEAGPYELGLRYTDRPNPAEQTPTPEQQLSGVPTPTTFLEGLGSLRGSLMPGVPAGEIFATGTGRSHLFTFQGEAGQFVSILMRRVAGTVDSRVTLYSPRARALATDDNSGGNRDALLRNILLPESGLYSLQAIGGGFPGSYEILLEVNERPAPVTPTIIFQPTATPVSEPLVATARPDLPGARLEDHAPVIGDISQPGGLGRHALFASSGDVITIGIRPLDAALRPVLEVYDPKGERIAAANTGGGGVIPALSLVESGPYTLLVTAEGNGTGAYQIAYGLGTSFEETIAGSASADILYDGQLARRGQRDVWTLLLNRGDVITAAVTPLDSIFDPLLELAGPDGALLASDDNSGGYPNALITSADASASGLYRLRVTGANAASSGRYRLVWRYINLAPTATPEPPRILVMSIADTVEAGEYHFYPFQGRAGQRVQIRVAAQPESGLDPVAALLDPNGEVIAEADDVGSDLNPHFTADITQDGTYTVRVNGYLSGGPFDLYVEALFERTS